MKAGRVNQSPAINSSRYESGKTGMQQHNEDRMGSRSGPMEQGDSRRDKFGSRHNQDAEGLQSPSTKLVQQEMCQVRMQQKRRHRTGSRK